ncbi:hypothetical protein Leryth_001776 [Lithospermum erythrorhizon]|nr:hypothetical protein Leryth_001776 [Lithospermum erythrorhizon]
MQGYYCPKDVYSCTEKTSENNNRQSLKFPAIIDLDGIEEDSSGLISNDKLKSVEHRALAKSQGPRISIAGFLSTGVKDSSRMYSPIEELLTEEEPPKYRATSLKEYTEYFHAKGLDSTSALPHFRL